MNLRVPRRTGRQTLRQIFAMPATIALISLVGLVSALTGDGVPDLISWLALTVPVGVLAWARRTRRS